MAKEWCAIKGPAINKVAAGTTHNTLLNFIKLPPLEDKFQRELDIARRVKRIRCCNSAEIAGVCWNTIGTKRTDHTSGHSEKRRVADVERFSPELEFHILLNREVLEYG